MVQQNSATLVFHQKLGTLFYAIAAADKVIKKAECENLIKIIEEQWKGIDEYKNPLNNNTLKQISIVFNSLKNQKMDATECFKSFSNFYKEHASLFSKKRKKLIFKTASNIAYAFSSINKSELVMLTKLQLLFNDK